MIGVGSVPSYLVCTRFAYNVDLCLCFALAYLRKLGVVELMALVFTSHEICVHRCAGDQGIRLYLGLDMHYYSSVPGLGIPIVAMTTIIVPNC